MTKYHVTNLLSKDEITACFNVHLSGYKKEKVVHYMYYGMGEKADNGEGLPFSKCLSLVFKDENEPFLPAVANVKPFTR